MINIYIQSMRDVFKMITKKKMHCYSYSFKSLMLKPITAYHNQCIYDGSFNIRPNSEWLHDNVYTFFFVSTNLRAHYR